MERYPWPFCYLIAIIYYSFIRNYILFIYTLYNLLLTTLLFILLYPPVLHTSTEGKIYYISWLPSLSPLPQSVQPQSFYTRSPSLLVLVSTVLKSHKDQVSFLSFLRSFDLSLLVLLSFHLLLQFIHCLLVQKSLECPVTFLRPKMRH